MDEIKELREEVVKLRERIAVLEASRQAPVPHLQWNPQQHWPQQPSWVYPYPNSIPPTITC